MCNLSCHTDQFAGFHPVREGVEEAVVSVIGKPADTEGFDDQTVIGRCQHIQNFSVCTGNQFHEKDAVIHLMIKDERSCILVFVINVKDDPAVMNGGNIRIINTGKSIVAFGKFFLGSGTCDDFAAEHDADAMRSVMRGKTEAVQEIGTGICDCQIDRFLGSCNDDRTAVILDQVRKCGGCVSHGICAVADDKSVVKFVFFFNELRKFQPVRSTDIGTVQGKWLDGINGTELIGSRNIFQ